MALYELVIDGTPTGKRRDFDDTPPDFTEHPTKGGWVWMPVVVVAPQGYDPKTQVRDGYIKSVDSGIVYENPQVRDKTLAELKADDLDKLRGQVGDLAVLQVRLIEQLLADNTIQATDFRPAVRQTYQDAKAIVDQRLDP